MKNNVATIQTVLKTETECSASKKCSRCFSIKEINLFHKKSNGLYGVDSKCKQCVSQSKRKYYNKKRRAKKGVIEIIDDSVGLPENALSLFAKLLEMQ